MITFGPVSSRRLGSSLGINNIPMRKLCTYSCIYCQLGETIHYSRFPDSFYEPSLIYAEVRNRLNTLSDPPPDYLTFVSNGEPTLDLNLGKSIERVKDFGIPVAVITNGSLLSDDRVRAMLRNADLVSLKCDAGSEETWKIMNRPMPELSFNSHKEGMLAFARDYQGRLITETMLVAGINDCPEIVEQTAAFVAELNPAKAYISVPVRPPALGYVKIPDESIVNEAWQQFSKMGTDTELLVCFEGVETGVTGNTFEDIINMCSVHPIREDTMKEILRKNNAGENIIADMVRDGHIIRLEYGSHIFFLRKFSK